MKKLLPLVLLLFAIQIGYGQGLRELYQKGVQAYEAKDYELFKNKMEQINEMRPNYPAVVYNLAAGYSLNGNKELAIKTLNQYVLMDAITDLSSDSDFESLLGTKEFEELLSKREKFSSQKSVEQIKNIPILEYHPESITYLKKEKAYFIGSVRNGNIWKIANDGKPAIWVLSPKNSWSVMGLEISHDGKYLWACTSSMNNYKDYKQHEEGYASVLKYNLNNRELLETYALPGGHNFGDLITDTEGNVYISDGVANKLYWINSKSNKLEEFQDLSDQVFNLQGLTLGGSEDIIYLSDYIDGIYRLNLQDKSLEKVQIKSPNILIKGIDGLYYKDNYLIGLHNGTKPNRVVKYQLSENGNAIIDKEVIAQAGILGEPTQGIWVENEFHFITNSPWGAYDRDGNFTPTGENIIIGVIK